MLANRFVRVTHLLGVFGTWAVLLPIPGALAQSRVVAGWNFNDGTTASDLLSVDAGSGTLTHNFNTIGSATGSSLSEGGSVTAGNALSLQAGSNLANNGKSLTFQFSTVGLSGVKLSYATQGTSNGFTKVQVQYFDTNPQVNNFVDFESSYKPATSYALKTFDFDPTKSAAYAALENNPQAKIRITFTSATNNAGTNQIDNVQISAAPEPGTTLLFGVAVSGLLLGRFRRRPAGGTAA